MTKEKIPILDRLILRKLWEVSEFGRLKYNSAKIVINLLRLGKENSREVLKEFKERGYIQCPGTQRIKIIIPLRDLV